MSTDLQSNPSMIPMAEQVEIERRVACAMTQTPREVVQAVLPRAPLDLWQRECAEGVMTPQTKLSSHANARLAVSSPESAAEREADQVADRLSQGRTTPSIREVAPSATVHRSGNSFAGAGVIPAGAGMPLPLPAREFFETGFGHSFNDVRIHTDAPAARSALSLQAEAFTVGRDIYFGAGKFDPKSAGGRRLIAHELTHTIQQQGGAESVMRQATTPAPTAAAPAAENAGPGPYDGCPDPQPLIAARTDAGARVAHAIELLRPANLQSAAPLLAKHFHVDTSRPESQRAVASIRAQLGRMASGLNSGIRIFCRSTPRTSAGLGRSPMPPSSECHSTTNAYSTSCANNEASATVILCEGRIAEGGDYVVKTIIHEFAHIACNGDPDIQPAGAEVYYDASQGLPGNVPNVLTYADSYALFVMDASSVQVAATEQANTRQAGAGRSRLPWLAVLGVGVGLGIGGIFAPGLLLGAGLGLGIGIAGLAGAFE